LLYTHVANVKTHILGGKTDLLESCFGHWIIHVWSSVPSQEIGWEERLRNDLLYVEFEWDVIIVTQSFMFGGICEIWGVYSHVPLFSPLQVGLSLDPRSAAATHRGNMPTPRVGRVS